MIIGSACWCGRYERRKHPSRVIHSRTIINPRVGHRRCKYVECSAGSSKNVILPSISYSGPCHCINIESVDSPTSPRSHGSCSGIDIRKVGEGSRSRNRSHYPESLKRRVGGGKVSNVYLLSWYIPMSRTSVYGRHVVRPRHGSDCRS